MGEALNVRRDKNEELTKKPKPDPELIPKKFLRFQRKHSKQIGQHNQALFMDCDVNLGNKPHRNQKIAAETLQLYLDSHKQSTPPP